MKHEDLIRQMSLEEKCYFLSGKDFWQTRSVERLGVPNMTLSDGPHGIRKQAGEGDHLGLNPSLPACIAREVSGRGFSVVYDTAAHIFQQFESGKFGRENPYEEAPEEDIDRCLRCDLLIMDDLGTEMVSPFVRSAFYRIVNERLLGRKKTVLSTNQIGRAHV